MTAGSTRQPPGRTVPQCDRCPAPASVVSPLGRLCSRHAREETERDMTALRRTRDKRWTEPHKVTVGYRDTVRD